MSTLRLDARSRGHPLYRGIAILLTRRLKSYIHDRGTATDRQAQPTEQANDLSSSFLTPPGTFTLGDGQADANVGRRSRALIGHHPYVAELAHVYGSKLLGCSSGNRYRPYLSSKRKYAHDSPPVEFLVDFLPRSAFAPAIPFRLHTNIL